jgi:hypothetical protein
MPIGQYTAAGSAGLGPGSSSGSSTYFTLRALPANVYGEYASGMTLATSTLQQSANISTTAPISGNFVNPVSTWPRFISGNLSMSYTLQRPASTQTTTVYGWVTHLDTLESAQSNGLSPAQRAVQSASLNGTGLGQAQLLGVGSTPLFGWSAPPVGVPTSYLVEIYRIDWGSFSFTTHALIARFRLPPSVTSLRLPPGFLQSGSHYYARIVSDSQPNSDFAARPFMLSFPQDFAGRVSGLFSP